MKVISNPRNFWVEAEVDGRKQPVTFGPRGKDGGFKAKIMARHAGVPEVMLGIRGYKHPTAENGIVLEIIAKDTTLAHYAKLGNAHKIEILLPRDKT